MPNRVSSEINGKINPLFSVSRKADNSDLAAQIESIRRYGK
jgi:hypothetical protein